MSASVTVTHEGPLTHVQLSRLNKLNAFDADLVDLVHETVTAGANDGTRLMVFSGAGKGFSGGFDLDGLNDSSDGDMVLRFIRVEEMLQAVYHAPFATLALSHGACYGAAADLVAACHTRIAAPGTRFRMPGPLFDVILGTRRLTQLVGADNTRALLQRDSPFDHEHAQAVGFVQRVVDQAQWPEIIQETLAQTLVLSANVYRAITERTATDTRDADLAALVRSVSAGSVKARIQAYLDAVRKARKR